MVGALIRALRVPALACVVGLTWIQARVSQPAAASGSTPCAAIAAAEPQTGHTMPPPAPVLFAGSFPALSDCEWGYPLGGWGGSRRHGPLRHAPVIFVHGNQADAENWYLVAEQFKQLAGYTDQEMYALSYNGLGNAYAGMPTRSQPSSQSIAYWQGTNPPLQAFANGGKGASDDPNVPDLYNFVRAVQDYTGVQQVDIVAHSLGVTITRKMLQLHPELRHDVLAAVMIAGGNHGTTVCRGIDTTYYGCEEIAPGTDWLGRLNSVGEAPGPTRWMSIYNGTDNTDPFFQQVPGAFDDRPSPHLEGAVNLTFPGRYHNDLRVAPDIVAVYLQFLLDHGQPAAVNSQPMAKSVQPVSGALPNTSR
jgi:pimeloyl-ACP methyl ester carboxylesterase